ncbi:MAG: hypothetical protein CL886_03585 [Dehalococcoidia bacterium]|nr:hypothetical protein [Dehalococcoidia bacterium]|tara:strand:- start:3809 stop:5653 length:1845 start_codon:yes stop_codon:yes gene_type:complete
MIWKVNTPINNLSSQLADMDIDDQTPLRIALDEEATKLTLSIFDMVKSTVTYELLSDILHSDKLDLYFEKYIRDHIYALMRTLYMCEWHQERNNVSGTSIVFWSDHKGLGPIVEELWPSKTTILKFSKWYHLQQNKQLLKSFTKRLLKMPFSKRKFSNKRINSPCIAVHANEGFNDTKRSDLFWFKETGFSTSDIIIVFRDTIFDERTPETVLQELDDKGFIWVCLKQNIVERKNAPLWRPSFSNGPLYKAFLIKTQKQTTSIEKLAMRIAKNALTEVDYWAAFYRELNVKISSDVEEGSLHNVAQCIALDIIGGIRISWQRSEVRLVSGGEFGHHPNHVYFVWNKLGLSDTQLNSNRVNSIVISGFPYSTTNDIDAPTAQIREHLDQTNAKLVIALFDNFFWWGGIYSYNMVSQFYLSFLYLVIHDKDIAVITKSKKPLVFESLPQLKPLMEQAKRTGRWINLPDVLGRLPSDASKISNISVGIGVSSAISEAASQGYRGVHIDLNRMYAHPLYKSGYGKVIFDDLDHLINQLKIFKLEKDTNHDLGSFNSHIALVDPFHDRKGNYRISDYVQSLLKSFQQGKTNEQAINIANIKYSSKWGSDKILSKASPSG